MIDRSYRSFYEELFREVLSKAPKSYFDEAALPSYTHQNKLMSHLFWSRLDWAFYLAGELKDKKVLDFGAGGGVTFKYLVENKAQIYACEKEFYLLTEMVAKALKINIPVFKDIMEIEEKIKFDVFFALDVFEHIEDINPILDKMLRLSHRDTKFVVSGPTESILYKFGRFLAGFKGHYHVKNIYDIEKDLRNRGFKLLKLKRLYLPITLFRVSLWGT